MKTSKTAAPRAVPAAGSQYQPHDLSWPLMAELLASNRASFAATGGLEPWKLIPLIEGALADPARRDAAMSEIVDYLSRTLEGAIPVVPPRHTSKARSARALPAARKSITEQATELLASAKSDPGDLRSDFATPFWCALEASNRVSVAKTGDGEPHKLVAIVAAALSHPEHGARNLASIVEYIDTCLDGCVPDVGAKLRARRAA